MKRLLVYCGLALVLALAPSCNRGTGCPAANNVQTKVDKKGKPKGKARTQLFDKKTRRKQG
ncbi:MAG: hypothetical protein WBA17_07965 [Saprospiraceae bacterium]